MLRGTHANAYKRKYKKSPGVSYKKALIYKSIDQRIVPATLSAAYNMQINSSTGWNSAGFQNLNFQFLQSGVTFNYGAAQIGSTSFANGSNFSTTFDQYRIKKISMEVFFSSNTSSVTTTTQLPMCYLVTDVDDTFGLGSATNALAYGSCIPFQLGANGAKYGKQIFYLNKPTIAQSAVNNQNSSTSTPSAALTVSPWLDCNATSVQHLGFKLFLDTIAATNVAEGYVTFVFKCIHEYRSTR
jgi:hypothetical protein